MSPCAPRIFSPSAKPRCFRWCILVTSDLKKDVQSQRENCDITKGWFPHVFANTSKRGQKLTFHLLTARDIILLEEIGNWNLCRVCAWNPLPFSSCHYEELVLIWWHFFSTKIIVIDSKLSTLLLSTQQHTDGSVWTSRRLVRDAGR